MENGGILLINKISIANDSVLGRLNSVFKTKRILILSEKVSSHDIEIVAENSFGVVSTMNLSKHFG